MRLVSAPNLKSVTTTGDGDVVGELEAALDAIDGRVGFTAKVAEARDVHGDVGAARKIGEAEMNTATGVLKAKFVEGGVTEDGVVLKSDMKSRVWFKPTREPEFWPRTWF